MTTLTRHWTEIALGGLILAAQSFSLAGQENSTASKSRPNEPEQHHHEQLDGSVIYDYDPSTKLGDDVFGTLIADFADPTVGRLRCSHGGPVCMEYANGELVAFYANTSSHNEDGWTEYAVSKDRGKTWDKYNKFAYSYESYQKDPSRPVWVEEGLVTSKGAVVLFLSQFEGRRGRIKNHVLRSNDHGVTWTAPEPVDGDVIGYPCAAAVQGDINYVLFDSNPSIEGGPGCHVLYASTDDGYTWQKRSTLPLENDKWYGALCVMEDGRLLAGAYTEKDENHFYYCISQDNGHTWGGQQRTHVDKKIRDPELACLDGKYYLHGRSGHGGPGSHRFVLYQSDDGVHWKEGVIVSGDARGPDGYSHNCIINKYDKTVPDELMIEYSIIYDPPRTNEYVFFVKPERQQGK